MSGFAISVDHMKAHKQAAAAPSILLQLTASSDLQTAGQGQCRHQAVSKKSCLRVAGDAAALGPDRRLFLSVHGFKQAASA